MSASPPVSRIASLDQFRGYTVLGMFLVNFVSGYEHIPRWPHFNHLYCSYHDTIMPQFFLAVGFSLRLVILRRLATDGAPATYWRMTKRGLGLILLGIVVYQLTGKFDTWGQLTESWRRDGLGGFLLTAIKRKPFETLTQIGVTTLFVLPVIAKPAWVRVIFAAVAGVVHAWLSLSGYYTWNMTEPVGIDGGPFGFLTWSIPLLAGTLAHDWVVGEPMQSANGARRMLAWGGALMLLGYGLSCLNRVAPPNVLPADAPFVDRLASAPFVPPLDPKKVQAERNYWTMSQRAGSVTYHLFAAGFGLAVLALFRVASDRWQFRWDYLDVLSRNALAGYLIHGFVGDAIAPFVPRDAPAGYVWAAFALYLAVVTVFLGYLDRHRLYLRL